MFYVKLIFSSFSLNAVGLKFSELFNMKVFRLSYFFFVLFLISCGRKTLIVEDGFGGLTAIATGKIIMNVSLAWAQSADNFEVIKTCEASGNSLSYHSESASTLPEATPCLVNIPEGRLFYSRIRFDLKKSAADSGCAVIKFYPYSYRKSNLPALVEPRKPTEVNPPGAEPDCGDKNVEPCKTKWAEWETQKTSYAQYEKDMNGYYKSPTEYVKGYIQKKSEYDNEDPVAKVNCDGTKGPVNLMCYGGLGREVDKFPTFKGLVSTAPSIQFTSKDVVRATGDGNRYVSNLNIEAAQGEINKFLKVMVNGKIRDFQDYIAYCDDIFGNTLAAMKITIGDINGDNPLYDHYCSWESSGQNTWGGIVDGIWSCSKDERLQLQ